MILEMWRRAESSLTRFLKTAAAPVSMAPSSKSAVQGAGRSQPSDQGGIREPQIVSSELEAQRKKYEENDDRTKSDGHDQANHRRYHSGFHLYAFGAMTSAVSTALTRYSSIGLGWASPAWSLVKGLTD
jgi:hypothetical protein